AAGKTGTIALMGYKTTHSGSSLNLYTSVGGVPAITITQASTGRLRVTVRDAAGAGAAAFQTTIAVNDGNPHDILIAFDTAEANVPAGVTIMVDDVDRTESYFTW